MLINIFWEENSFWGICNYFESECQYFDGSCYSQPFLIIEHLILRKFQSFFTRVSDDLNQTFEDMINMGCWSWNEDKGRIKKIIEPLETTKKYSTRSIYVTDVKSYDKITNGSFKFLHMNIRKVYIYHFEFWLRMSDFCIQPNTNIYWVHILHMTYKYQIHGFICTISGSKS